MPFSIRALLRGGAQAGAGYLGGQQERQQREAEAERQARLDAIQESLLGLQQTRSEREDRGQLYDEMMGRTRLMLDRGEARRRAGEDRRNAALTEAGEQRKWYEAETGRIRANRPPAPSVAAQRAQTDQQYDDAVGRAMLALRKHEGNERLALAELGQVYPEMPVGIRQRAIAEAKYGTTRQEGMERRNRDPLAGLLDEEPEAESAGELIPVSQIEYDEVVNDPTLGEAYARRYYRVDPTLNSGRR